MAFKSNPFFPLKILFDLADADLMGELDGKQDVVKACKLVSYWKIATTKPNVEQIKQLIHEREGKSNMAKGILPFSNDNGERVNIQFKCIHAAIHMQEFLKAPGGARRVGMDNQSE